tara:strand:+ start:264 stop:473 length:210 start_codon:yes stop_codon:yes gene_type:complete
MSTPFIILVEGAIGLLDRARDNINDTGKDAFRYEVEHALYTLNGIKSKYHESLDRFVAEPIEPSIKEVK